MMKTKRIFLVIFAILMFSTCVNADDFSIRNDIHFGDSMETVKEKEVLGIDYESSIPDIHGITSLYSKLGTIAGIDNSQVIYYFCNDELCEIIYGLNANEKKLDTLESEYNDIYEGIVRKYGEPLYDDSKKEGKHDILTHVSIYISAFCSKMNSPYHALDYNEWVIEYDNYNLKIDLSGMYKLTDNKIEETWIYVGYEYFTNEMLKEIQEKENEKQEEKQKLIDDDL